MAKKFNVTGQCVPEYHYMVKLDDRLKKIKELIDGQCYFTINRARQYGKTTTLFALERYLKEDYLVIRLDFQLLGNKSFEDEVTFSRTLADIFVKKIRRNKEASKNLSILLDALSDAKEDKNFMLYDLFIRLSELCGSAKKPVVLMIDEVDNASNNQVFFDFLAQLRGYYLNRFEEPTFQSVILASVYDIKNLKQKIRPDEVHKVNSPWNIAEDFDLDMSFSDTEIAKMLWEYEEDYHTNMDVKEIAGLIFDYTSGYPYLVSRLCKLMDEKVNKSVAWTKAGFLEALRMILEEKNTLFDSLTGKIMENTELDRMLHTLLFEGKMIVFSSDSAAINLAMMFGFVKKQQNTVMIANRIFETRLYNMYLSDEGMRKSRIYTASVQEKNQFIVNGRLDMRRILQKFTIHFNDLYGNRDETFVEEEGRKYFLLYLRPIINGTGNYYIESRTRTMGRTDVIVDYRGEQYIIEMKIWRGQEYNERGETQLLGYLNDYHKKVGYMLSFNFNKNKTIGVNELKIGDKVLIEAVV